MDLIILDGLTEAWSHTETETGAICLPLTTTNLHKAQMSVFTGEMPSILLTATNFC